MQMNKNERHGGRVKTKGGGREKQEELKGKKKGEGNGGKRRGITTQCWRETEGSNAEAAV